MLFGSDCNNNRLRDVSKVKRGETVGVLSEYFAQVLVLERDQMDDRPVLHKSIPQGNHLHVLLQGGQQVLSSLYPDFTGALRTLGATRASVGRDIVWYLPDGKAYKRWRRATALPGRLPPALILPIRRPEAHGHQASNRGCATSRRSISCNERIPWCNGS
jgi:hypothetical protein